MNPPLTAFSSAADGGGRGLLSPTPLPTPATPAVVASLARLSSPEMRKLFFKRSRCAMGRLVVVAAAASAAAAAAVVVVAVVVDNGGEDEDDDAMS